ncbi:MULTISPECIES: D-alanyl-D-alanine carboxypeptidase family protein [Ruminococcus]|uniref:serine-type D-Ala-D-Ala carboxypeptidase n=1 Tax=Ruminococcus flavefaciens TaxID=1265 RepID=A0A1M7H2Z7_RUMFL|nr:MULTISPECIES: serine hydrolase [Ruminococcus]MCR4795194.1 serine hydrolase [Ruminococcus sp.]SHM22850.1 D-alanyl-D-alanine carboxypeptidase (penicillin-binding protein 5/6) [Ruminococcus flavefaciens]
MRIFFRAIILFLCVGIAFTFISADISDDSEPAAYVLIEADTGTVLDAKNENIRTNPGYLTKLMSILVTAKCIEKGELSVNEILTASESVSGTNGSVVWLQSGDKMSVEELLKAVIIGNANDAVTVLAEHISGNIDGFVMDMNAEAFELGLRDTYFVSPYGYADESNYTTAHDMAVICAELSRFDFLEPYFKIWRDFIKNGQVELVSENTLTRDYGPHIGFKASHFKENGYFLAEGGRNSSGYTFITVVFGAQNEEQSFKKGKELLKMAFSGYRVVSTEFPEEMLVPLKVKKGVESAVEIGIKEQGKAAVAKENKEIRAKVVIPEYISAPVKEGQPIGTAAFFNGDTLVFETDIITKSSVPVLTWDYVLKQMMYKMIEK